MRIRFLRAGGLFAALAIVAAGFAACGDDDDGGGGGGGTGTDEEYVSAICNAFLQLQEDIQAVVEDSSGDETEEEAVELLLPPLEDYLANLKDANPPADVKQYHDDVVQTTEDAINRMRDEKNPSVFDEVAEPEEPPQEIQDRLNEVAQSDDTCVEAEFNFGEE